jgi:hypothetical protein
MVPHLFTRVTVRWGEPIHVDRDADSDAVLVKLEAALTACQRAADKAVGAQTEPVDVNMRPALQATRDGRRDAKVN